MMLYHDQLHLLRMEGRKHELKRQKNIFDQQLNYLKLAELEVFDIKLSIKVHGFLKKQILKQLSILFINFKAGNFNVNYEYQNLVEIQGGLDPNNRHSRLVRIAKIECI